MNNQTKHTPGPWIVQQVAIPFTGFEVVTAPNGEKGWPNYRGICRLPNTKPEDKANSRLIAAAPDLLAACEAVEQAQRNGDYEQAFKLVRNAINKATGS